MKKICKNCKFFKKDSIYEGLGKCRHPKLKYTCWPENIDKEEKKNMLIYCDSEMYGAELYVGEEFGCIHFKPKK